MIRNKYMLTVSITKINELTITMTAAAVMVFFKTYFLDGYVSPRFLTFFTISSCPP